MNATNKQLMSAREVAEVLGVHWRTVMRWGDAGVIPAVRIGGVVRYRAADIERLLDDEGGTDEEELKPGRPARATPATTT
jgi:excisionase family DNA binding protein